jgi:uncharacterized damage-inducible protein DinB
MTREWLIETWSYNTWANLRWLPVAPTCGGEDVMRHILQVEGRWLQRLKGETPTRDQTVDETQIRKNEAEWAEFLATCDFDRVLEIVGVFDRGTVHMSCKEIALHALNHSTYHRGHLRRLAEEAGIDWPESDRCYWTIR